MSFVKTNRKQRIKNRSTRVRYNLLRKAKDSDKPRLAIFKTCQHIYAQVIDRDGKVVTAFSSINKDFTRKGVAGCNVAEMVGKEIGKRAKDKGVKKVIFDRGGWVYHGRIKSLADAAREYLDF